MDVPTTGKCFGFGRSKTYALARSGKFPVLGLPFGGEFRVTRASILACLGITAIRDVGKHYYVIDEYKLALGRDRGSDDDSAERLFP